MEWIHKAAFELTRRSDTVSLLVGYGDDSDDDDDDDDDSDDPKKGGDDNKKPSRRAADATVQDAPTSSTGNDDEEEKGESGPLPSDFFDNPSEAVGPTPPTVKSTVMVGVGGPSARPSKSAAEVDFE